MTRQGIIREIRVLLCPILIERIGHGVRAPSASDIFFRFVPATERFKTYLPVLAR